MGRTNETLLVSATLDEFMAALKECMGYGRNKREELNGIAATLGDLADVLGITPATLGKIRKAGFMDDAEIQINAHKVVYDIDKAQEGYLNYKRHLRENKIYE